MQEQTVAGTSRVVQTLKAFVVHFIPLWLFIAVRVMVAPQGFWQELALGVAGYIVLGGAQLISFGVFVFRMYRLWSPPVPLSEPTTKTVVGR